MKSAWPRATRSRCWLGSMSSTGSRKKPSRRSDSLRRWRRFAVRWAFQLDRVAFGVRKVNRRPVALRAVALPHRADGDVMPLQVSDDRLLVERLDAKAEMVEVEAAGLGRGEAAFMRFDEIQHASADAQMGHGEVGPVGDVLRAQHVAVEGAHGIDVAHAQDEVVDVSNLDRCHGYMIALS